MRTIKERNQALEFRDRRFEFYASGRLLAFQGALCAAPVLLAYALEYELKAALNAARSAGKFPNRKLVYGHEFCKLYDHARELGVLQKTLISSDLLTYAEDHFNRRYPGGSEKLLKKPGYWTFTRSKVFSFDDAICQIDDALVDYTQESEETMGLAALLNGCGFRSPLAEAFFHFNPFTLARLAQYQAALDPSSLYNVQRQWTVEDLYSSEHLGHAGWSSSRILELRHLDLAAYFRYPKREDPDPDPIGIFLNERSDPHHLIYSKWVIDGLRKTFGSLNVAVLGDNHQKEIRAVVFDRTACEYSRSLVLESREDPACWVRNEETIGKLEKWIAQTKAQFEAKWNSL